MHAPDAPPVVALRDIEKTYSGGRRGAPTTRALRGLTLDIRPGEYVAIMGPSGCGKSTLLNILGLLDQPSAGSYRLDGHEIATLNDDHLSALRGRKIGFVFQSYNLIPQLSVLDNIALPLAYQGVPEPLAHDRARELAERVGIAEHIGRRPAQLSGGQQQRAAIARSLVTRPTALLADEATGNLDSKSGAEILDLFDEINRAGATILFVTHDESIAERTHRIIRLRDGLLESDEATP